MPFPDWCKTDERILRRRYWPVTVAVEVAAGYRMIVHCAEKKVLEMMYAIACNSEIFTYKTASSGVRITS